MSEYQFLRVRELAEAGKAEEILSL